MKINRKMKTSVALAALAISTSSLSAATTWFYGAGDNSASFGVSADNYQAITWMDAFASAGAADDPFASGDPLQVNRPNLLGQGQSIMMFGFGGTGLASADVNSAMLYLIQDTTLSSTNTWQIVGIPDSDWDNVNMTWNDLDNSDPGVDWTGDGTLADAITGNYGSFSTDPGENGGGVVSVDVTSAFQAYLDGTISGIAFVNDSNGSNLTAGDQIFQAFSNETTDANNRPGLLVDAIPEPSALLLSAVGALVLFRRRRP